MLDAAAITQFRMKTGHQIISGNVEADQMFHLIKLLFTMRSWHVFNVNIFNVF